MNNFKNYIQLPYIYISELGGKFLIDTGASQSLINPKALRNKKFKIEKVLHLIKTANSTSKHNKVAFEDLPERIFKEKIKHKFLICDFDSDFIGFLGIDFLIPQDCEIDMKKGTLKTKKN